MLKKWLPPKGVFRRFLVTYLIIMFAFVCTVGIISSVMISSITEYDKNNQYQAANNANDMLNQQIQNVRNLCTQIKNDAGVSYTSFLKGRKNLINVSDGDLKEIKKNIYESIATSVLLNYVVEDIYLFSAEDDAVIFSHGSMDADIMYGSAIKFGDMSLDEFREKYLRGEKYGEFSSAMNVYNTGTNTESILYIESYPTQPFVTPTGYIVVSLKLSEILNILGYVPSDNEKQIYLYAPDGGLIYSSLPVDGNLKIDKDGLCEIHGEKYITYSSKNNVSMNFVSAGRYDSTIKKTISIRTITMSVLFCAILIGFVLSVYFAKFNTKPIKGLIAKLENVKPSGGEIGDEYRYIEKSIESIVNDALVIEKDFEKERPVLINDFVNSVLLGRYTAQNEIEEIAEKLRVEISGKKFAVMLLEIMDNGDETASNREKLRYIQKSVSEEYRHRFNCLTYMNGMDSIYILFRLDDEDSSKNIESIETVTYTIGETLYERLKVSLKCALGGFYDSIFDVPYSYEGARKLLENGTQVEYRHIIWCVQSDGAMSWYYYPSEIENRIENAFRSRNSDEINHILGLVHKENYMNRVLNSSAIRLLYMNMKITVHDIMRQYCSEFSEKQRWEMVDKIDENSDMNKFFDELDNLYCELIKISHEKSMKQEILDYVNNAALNVDFDRQMFAKRFFISPEYVSKFFKENTGYGFTKYATKVRIDKACELLKDDNYNIERISEAVGYSSALSFRRAFKSNVGVSPSEYRRKFVEDENVD